MLSFNLLPCGIFVKEVLNALIRVANRPPPVLLRMSLSCTSFPGYIQDSELSHRSSDETKRSLNIRAVDSSIESRIHSDNSSSDPTVSHSYQITDDDPIYLSKPLRLSSDKRRIFSDPLHPEPVQHNLSKFPVWSQSRTLLSWPDDRWLDVSRNSAIGSGSALGR